MKKVIIVAGLFVVSLGIIQMWGPNAISIGMLAIATFLAGLFIGQRTKRA